MYVVQYSVLVNSNCAEYLRDVKARRAQKTAFTGHKDFHVLSYSIIIFWDKTIKTITRTIIISSRNINEGINPALNIRPPELRGYLVIDATTALSPRVKTEQRRNHQPTSFFGAVDQCGDVGNYGNVGL